MIRRRVIIESPYAGDVANNVGYAQRALFDSLERGEAPIASHLTHTQVLNDQDPIQRTAGMEAGIAWLPVAELVAFYVDYGISPGMQLAHGHAEGLGIPIEERTIGKNTACEVCGCTDYQACEEGCWWVFPTICSTCYDEGARPRQREETTDAKLP